MSVSRIKISFLFFLGLCFVIITLLNESGRNNAIEALQNKGLHLAWDGTQLIVVKSKNKAAVREN